MKKKYVTTTPRLKKQGWRAPGGAWMSSGLRNQSLMYGEGDTRLVIDDDSTADQKKQAKGDEPCRFR